VTIGIEDGLAAALWRAGELLEFAHPATARATSAVAMAGVKYLIIYLPL
jgi:hypothetical protein